MEAECSLPSALISACSLQALIHVQTDHLRVSCLFSPCHTSSFLVCAIVPVLLTAAGTRWGRSHLCWDRALALRHLV